MKKILILRGLPASGKSTFARNLLTENPHAWKRLNKDELRAMLDNSVHSVPNEKFVEYARPLIEGEVKIAIEAGLPKYVELAKSPVEKKLPARS